MTLLTTVQAAAEELGIRSPSAVAGSSDTTAKRLYRIARRAATDLRDAHDWSVLIKLATITSTGASTYSLASDFLRGVRDTTWNTTDSWRQMGHVFPQQWQHRINGYAVSTDLNSAFRISVASGTRQIEFDPAPDNGDSITYQYVSNAIFDSGSGLVSGWTADAYTCLLDEGLITQGIIWRMLRSVGREYQDHKREYEHEVRDSIAQDVPAETVFLGRESGERIIAAVVPDTGYG